MIVLDTTVLVYAVGAVHPLAEGCRALVEAVGEERIQATTTAEAIQEFVHVRAKRRTRPDATALGRAYLDLLSPLLPVDAEVLGAGLRLYERHTKLGAFDAVLAAAALRSEAEALVSADAAFGSVKGLRWVDPAGPKLQALLVSDR